MIDCARAFVNVCLPCGRPFPSRPFRPEELEGKGLDLDLALGLAFCCARPFRPEERLVGADLRCGIFNI